jgi:hypothetical protein
VFDQKWEGIDYAHPHNEADLQQAIHWACITAKFDPNTITILISKDTIWYHNFNPYTGPFLDTHIITHFATDTIIYEEPTIPPELNTTRKELSTLRILCIHHQNNHIGTYEQMNELTDIANNLQILQVHTQIAPPTPVNTTVNPSKNGLN